MHATRLFQLLLLAVAVVCVAQAIRPDTPRYHARRDIARRQNEDPDATTTDPPTQTNDPTESPSEDPASETTENTQTTTTAVPPTQTTATEDTTTTQDEPTTSATNGPSQTTTSGTRTTTGADTESTSSASETTTGPPSEDNETTTTQRSISLSTSMAVVTRTNSDGSTQTWTSMTTFSITPGLNGGSSGQSEGMSAQTRDTIIGVVVGVGGAILIGALVILWWRLRSRKRQAEENDGLMAYDNNNMASGMEKSEPSISPPGTVSSSQPQRNPFQSTLETYHAPASVNASSNF